MKKLFIEISLQIMKWYFIQKLDDLSEKIQKISKDEKLRKLIGKKWKNQIYEIF